jgi:hypothetical protein
MTNELRGVEAAAEALADQADHCVVGFATKQDIVDAMYQLADRVVEMRSAISAYLEATTPVLAGAAVKVMEQARYKMENAEWSNWLDDWVGLAWAHHPVPGESERRWLYALVHPKAGDNAEVEPVGYVTGSNLRALKDGIMGVMTVNNQQNAVFQNPIYAQPPIKEDAKGGDGEVERLRAAGFPGYMDIPLISDLQRHVEEIGHTEIGQDIQAAIEVIRSLSSAMDRVRGLADNMEGYIDAYHVSYALVSYIRKLVAEFRPVSAALRKEGGE